MPATLMPDSVTRKVIAAASRWRGSAGARLKPPAMLPSSASPATVATSS